MDQFIKRSVLEQFLLCMIEYYELGFVKTMNCVNTMNWVQRLKVTQTTRIAQNSTGPFCPGMLSLRKSFILFCFLLLYKTPSN